MKSILITGGCGFIGSNAAKQFMSIGWNVTVLDNHSRVGAVDNLKWLQGHGNLIFKLADVRDSQVIEEIIKAGQFDYVLHLAGQVAVTTSVLNPREDFEINALGSFNLLEAIRKFSPESVVLYSSTNKVYGNLDELKVIKVEKSYSYEGLPLGVSESSPLDFHSPYGCSKGTADQYFLDYARIYNLKTIVFRQSCIYGPRQFGIEDQGWVAWFIIAATLKKPISIFGDGMQVRDALYVDDLIYAYQSAFENSHILKGQAFNIGGGPENTLSLIKLLEILKSEFGRDIEYKFADWRPGDQKVFICDISKFSIKTNWKPQVSCETGVRNLISWVAENKIMIESVLK